MSQILDSLTQILMAEQNSTAILVGASVVSTFAVISLTRLVFEGTQQKIIPGPGTTLLPNLRSEDLDKLGYPPNALPGGRNVASPYGTIRVYEWGPEDGRKVLLVHGITTPCIALGAVARGLVEKGCRVMLFDLWGRGYTDSVADLEHDDRLYSSEILIALSSSPLPWINGSDGGFDLIGYSLGGGIAAAFTSYFSHTVRTLTLLAPAGIIRSKHMSGRSRLLYSHGLVPEPVLLWLVKRRLLAGPMYAKENKEIDDVDAAAAEVEGERMPHSTTVPLSTSRPDITVPKAVQWQLRNHGGFVRSFLSSVRFAPITGQEEAWTRLGKLRNDKVLIIAGTQDPIVIVPEIREDAERLLGKEKVRYKELDSTHDFPINDSKEVVDEIWASWGH